MKLKVPAETLPERPHGRERLNGRHPDARVDTPRPDVRGPHADRESGGANREGEPRDQAHDMLLVARATHLREVVRRGGRETQFAQDEPGAGVELADGTRWEQRPTDAGNWSDIQVFDEKGSFVGQMASFGAMLLPTQEEIDAYEPDDNDNRPDIDPHSLDFNVANVRQAVTDTFGERITPEERRSAIFAWAAEQWGDDWHRVPGPDHPEFQARERILPGLPRVPEYRYTIIGAIGGLVRIASHCVPWLGGKYRAWEDRLMYRVDMKMPAARRIGGGAYDTENGPNKFLLQEWQTRHNIIQDALAKAQGHGLDEMPSLRDDAERQALAEASMESLSHAPRMSAAMAQLFADLRSSTADRTHTYDWTADEPLRPVDQRPRQAGPDPAQTATQQELNRIAMGG